MSSSTTTSSVLRIPTPVSTHSPSLSPTTHRPNSLPGLSVTHRPSSSPCGFYPDINTRTSTAQSAINRFENPRQDSATTNRIGGPLDWYLGDTESVLVPQGSRLSSSHPTQHSASEPAYSNTGSADGRFHTHYPDDVSSVIGTESVASYGYQTSTNPSSWHGSSDKQDYLDHSGRRSSGDSRQSVSPTWPKPADHQHASFGVNPMDVNNRSAGASDHSDDDRDDPYHTHPNFYIQNYNWASSRIPPTPQEVQPRESFGTQTRPLHLAPPGPGPIRTHHSRRHTITPIARGPRHSTPGKRPFICTFRFANCTQTFATKNEWKRHVSSQHIQSRVWRCDFSLCSDRKAAVFNRKDLFGQHLRRMHKPANQADVGHFISTDIPMVQKRCEKLCRAPPDKTACGFCGKRFMGSGGWEERMEHVGRHYENASTTVEDVGVSAWTMDMAVMEWALKEGVVVRDQAGGYSLVSMGKDAVVGGHGSR